MLRSVCVAAALFLSPATCLAAAPGSQPIPIHLMSGGQGKKNVSFSGEKTPIRAVLALLFRRANQSYVFGPRVTGYVTATLINVPFDTAVDQLAAANSVPLTETVLSGIYLINLKSRPQPAPTVARRRAMVTRRSNNGNTGRQGGSYYSNLGASGYSRPGMYGYGYSRRGMYGHGYGRPGI